MQYGNWLFVQLIKYLPSHFAMAFSKIQWFGQETELNSLPENDKKRNYVLL